MSDLYDRDFYRWANEQAALLRAGKLCLNAPYQARNQPI